MTRNVSDRDNATTQRSIQRLWPNLYRARGQQRLRSRQGDSLGREYAADGRCWPVSLHAPSERGACRTVGSVLEVHLEAELQNSGRIRSSDGSEWAGAKSRAGVGDAGAVAVEGAPRVG